MNGNGIFGLLFVVGLLILAILLVQPDVNLRVAVCVRIPLFILVAAVAILAIVWIQQVLFGVFTEARRKQRIRRKLHKLAPSLWEDGTSVVQFSSRELVGSTSDRTIDDRIPYKRGYRAAQEKFLAEVPRLIDRILTRPVSFREAERELRGLLSQAKRIEVVQTERDYVPVAVWDSETTILDVYDREVTYSVPKIT